jgi:hypothetical protein
MSIDLFQNPPFQTFSDKCLYLLKKAKLGNRDFSKAILSTLIRINVMEIIYTYFTVWRSTAITLESNSTEVMVPSIFVMSDFWVT